MACVYRSLDEFSDNQSIYDKLKAMKIIPLATYQRQSTNNSTIFFPLSENTGFSYNGKKKYAMCLHFVVKKIKCSSFPLWNKMQEWNTHGLPLYACVGVYSICYGHCFTISVSHLCFLILIQKVTGQGHCWLVVRSKALFLLSLIHLYLLHSVLLVHITWGNSNCMLIKPILFIKMSLWGKKYKIMVLGDHLKHKLHTL